MAARSSAGVGMIVTVVVLGVLSLGLFVGTIVFWSQLNRERAERVRLETDNAAFVSAAERTSNVVEPVRAAAQASGKSVLGYLMSSMQTTMQRVTGSPRDTVQDLEAKLNNVTGAETADLLTVIRGRDQRIADLTSQLAEATAARDRALADRENEVRRVADIETSNREALAALTADVDKYKDDIDTYREQLTEAKALAEGEVDKYRAEAREIEARLNADLGEMQQQLVLAQEQSRRLQEQLRGQTFKPGDEYALVDGQIIGMDSAENAVYLNVGRNQKAVLGMTFEVYSDAASIRPDPTSGEYPEGKAAVEIIRVDDDSSTGRIVREKRGNPVVKGDVIANAIYDPKKSYKMLVFGNFDANGDGRATVQEQADIAAMIEQWGGEVVTELSGHVDFLVLGQRPVLPPQPPSDAPVPVVQEYIRQRRVVQEYDRLFEQATATSIPVLTENRLRTLIGGGSGR